MIAGLLALISATLFSGAAIYVNVVEHPARMLLQDGPLLAQWQPSYKRGFMMQASLAVIGCLLGLLAAYETSQLMFVVGAALIVANWPWTMFAMLPLNNRLMATPSADAGAETRSGLVRWNRLHAVRTLLGFAAVAAFSVALWWSKT